VSGRSYIAQTKDVCVERKRNDDGRWYKGRKNSPSGGGSEAARSSPRTGKLTIVGFFSAKKALRAKRRTWSAR
jgi:hypothetical protein